MNGVSVFDPWPLLASVRRFEVTIDAGGAGRPCISHAGTGGLRVEASTSAGSTTLTWHEAGEWVGGPLCGIRFHSITAWRRQDGDPRLHLSHLRRGAKSPTFLATLATAESGRWIAEAPHVCGEDRYRPTLEAMAEGVRITWEVESETDPYTLRFEAWV